MNKNIVSIKEEDKPLIWINPKVITMEQENKELKEKLSKIKELINRTPRQTPKEIAYILLKSEIAEIIGDDKD